MTAVAAGAATAAVAAVAGAASDETEDFIKLLDSRELAAVADEQLLVHLLLRADAINRRALDWRRLKVTFMRGSDSWQGVAGHSWQQKWCSTSPQSLHTA